MLMHKANAQAVHNFFPAHSWLKGSKDKKLRPLTKQHCVSLLRFPLSFFFRSVGPSTWSSPARGRNGLSRLFYEWPRKVLGVAIIWPCRNDSRCHVVEKTQWDNLMLASFFFSLRHRSGAGNLQIPYYVNVPWVRIEFCSFALLPLSTYN